jgi:hypothetical protein
MADHLHTVLRVRDANRLLGVEHVRWMVHSGRWQRPVRGVVVRHSGTLTFEERIDVELLAQPEASVLAGLTAAAFDGLQGFPSATIFLTAPHTTRARTRPSVVVKRSRTLTVEDIHPSRTPRRTRLPRSVVDAAAWCGPDLRSQAIIASAVQQRLVTPEQLTTVVTRLPVLRKHA